MAKITINKKAKKTDPVDAEQKRPDDGGFLNQLNKPSANVERLGVGQAKGQVYQSKKYISRVPSNNRKSARSKSRRREKAKKVIIMTALLVLVVLVFFLFVFGDQVLGIRSWNEEVVMSRTIPLCEKMRCDNTAGFGKRVRLEVTIFALAKEGKQEELSELVARHDPVIRDAVREIISSASYAQISDPQKADIAESILQRVTEITGKNLTKKILFPEWERDPLLYISGYEKP